MIAVMQHLRPFEMAYIKSIISKKVLPVPGDPAIIRHLVNVFCTYPMQYLLMVSTPSDKAFFCSLNDEID